MAVAMLCREMMMMMVVVVVVMVMGDGRTCVREMMLMAVATIAIIIMSLYDDDGNHADVASLWL
jgi:hypothetical protein